MRTLCGRAAALSAIAARNQCTAETTAIQEKKAVIVGDVRTNPRYLTAFGSTLSEIIVPVLSPDGRVIGPTAQTGL